ncbi:PilZ domain-containing protein [Patescibacteria group bacterium]|nr:PilZ domain-containing protein [Patescibacteria group bacterium]MBU4479773.1 PilZ domain-containing protein [Candidatus Omnitrophota bacterium]
MKTFMEKRRFIRLKIKDINADYNLVDFNFWPQFRARGKNLLCDISLGGISFQTKYTLPLYSLLRLNLMIADAVACNDVYGRIVRITSLGNNDYEIGVNFSWWTSEADRAGLVRFLNEKMSAERRN